MIVNGSIGEMCTVEARIIGIYIEDTGVSYSLDIDGVHVYRVNGNIIHFSDYFADQCIEDPVPEEIEDATLPEDDEWSHPATKKRGRPRKATVEDLVKRAKEES